MRRRFSLREKLGRLIHFRLVIPLMRSPHPPEYTARSVMVGLFWAFTPLIGVQMYLVGLTWLITRINRRWDFSIIVSLAWTWVTNVFTMVPTYYVFYVVGQLLMGNFDAHFGYDHFAHAWHAAVETEGFFKKFAVYGQVIATEQGLPMVIGSLPFSFGSAWLGYRWSLKFVIRRRRIRAEKRARAEIRRRERRAAAAAKRRARPADHRA